MFCPNCGRDNLNEQKFCATCGTNLEAVSQLLFGREVNFFTRIDTELDQFTARYAEHIFKNAPSHATDRTVANSWKLLGKGILTSFLDVFLAVVLWNFFVFRFHILWISTPFRLLFDRNRREKKEGRRINTERPISLPEQPPGDWISGAAPSVSEHTTDRLQEYRRPNQKVSGEG
jgi:zinc ribbon protein